jgi:hypothetical protein
VVDFRVVADGLALTAWAFFVAVAFLTLAVDFGLPTGFLPAVDPVPVDLVVVGLLGCFFVVAFVGFTGLAAAFAGLAVAFAVGFAVGFAEGFVAAGLVVADRGLAGLFCIFVVSR